MQLYIVQFKQYQGIILIFLKHVNNSKLQGDNCNVVSWVSSSTEPNKATFISKTLAHNSKTSNNLAMITVL